MSVNEFTTGELVEFKGSKKGIIVNIKRKATFDEIKNSIIDKLESSIGFFNGAKICSINCEYLSDIQIMMLKDDISSKFDVEFIEEYNKKEITNFQTKYVTNLRSGENIEFDGDIIVMCSDGIIESNTEYLHKDLWLKYFLEELQTDDVQQIADLIISEAIDNDYGKEKDDMTVIVAKVSK